MISEATPLNSGAEIISPSQSATLTTSPQPWKLKNENQQVFDGIAKSNGEQLSLQV